MARYGKKHGMWNTKIYHVWQGMKQRCEDKNRENYKRYGARGISVCEEWHDPQVFINWALSHGYQEGLTLDRIDNDGDYSPENCRWADQHTQDRNKSTNHFIEYNGERKCLTDWSRDTGIPIQTIFGRLKKGWPVEEALSPSSSSHASGKRTKYHRSPKQFVEYDGVSRSFKGWSEVTGIPESLLRKRVNYRGWTPERALTTPARSYSHSGQSNEGVS